MAGNSGSGPNDDIGQIMVDVFGAFLPFFNVCDDFDAGFPAHWGTGVTPCQSAPDISFARGATSNGKKPFHHRDLTSSSNPGEGRFPIRVRQDPPG